MLKQEVENYTVMGTSGYPFKQTQPTGIKCDCGCRARMMIKGQYICFDCAEDGHEVKML